jgi:hypothetical protein
MLQIHVEGRKVVAMLPNHKYMHLMPASVDAGCKLRALCLQCKREKEYIHESLQLSVTSMREIKNRLWQEQRALGAQDHERDATIAEKQKKSRSAYKESHRRYVPIKEYHEDLIKELRASEKKWLQ